MASHIPCPVQERHAALDPVLADYELRLSRPSEAQLKRKLSDEGGGRVRLCCRALAWETYRAGLCACPTATDEVGCGLADNGLRLPPLPPPADAEQRREHVNALLATAYPSGPPMGPEIRHVQEAAWLGRSLTRAIRQAGDGQLPPWDELLDHLRARVRQEMQVSGQQYAIAVVLAATCSRRPPQT